MDGCGKIGGLEALGGIKCTKLAQNWAESTSSAPSPQNYPHSMNGSAPKIMRAHMYIFLLIWSAHVGVNAPI